MVSSRLLLILSGVFLAASGASAAAPDDDAAALAATIDRHLAAAWEANKVQPAPPAGDAEFVRRVYLDLAGRIPTVAEVRTFFDDKRRDKRRRLVEQLLQGPRYVTHFTNVWRALLLPETMSNLQTSFLAPGFELWLRDKLQHNTPYDALVRELVTLPLEGPGRNPYGGPNSAATPIAFYLAKELKPENLAASVSRLFLGAKIECAQCHNHPFADWRREQFWSFAAFFAGLQRRSVGDFVTAGQELADRRELAIPGSQRVVQAVFLDGGKPKWKRSSNTRAALAEWMTRKDNPYFARTAANRLWAYFFGSGIIDPVEEMADGQHPASHPELLDELARQLAEHNFDLKFLIRAFTASRAYQLSSRATHPSQNDPRWFARMSLRGLSAEQLFDSIAAATGYREEANPNPRYIFNNPGVRSRFLTQFANSSDKPTEAQTSILQALSMMNGQLTAAATDLERSQTLLALLDAPFMDTAERMETLCLATLARKPTPRELTNMIAYVEKGGSAGDSDNNYRRALADVFWVLLNSGEFFLNH